MHDIIGKSLIWLTATIMLLVISLPVFAAQAAKNKPKNVIVAPVVLKEISDIVEALGTARANESVNISSNITEKIKQINFEDGQMVKARQTLVVLDQDEERPT